MIFILWELGAVKMVPHPRGGFAFFQAEGMFLRKPADTLPENTAAGRPLRTAADSAFLSTLSFFCGCISLCVDYTLSVALFHFRTDLQDPVPRST